MSILDDIAKKGNSPLRFANRVLNTYLFGGLLLVGAIGFNKGCALSGEQRYKVVKQVIEETSPDSYVAYECVVDQIMSKDFNNPEFSTLEEIASLISPVDKEPVDRSHITVNGKAHFVEDPKEYEQIGSTSYLYSPSGNTISVAGDAKVEIVVHDVPGIVSSPEGVHYFSKDNAIYSLEEGIIVHREFSSKLDLFPVDGAIFGILKYEDSDICRLFSSQNGTVKLTNDTSYGISMKLFMTNHVPLVNIDPKFSYVDEKLFFMDESSVKVLHGDVTMISYDVPNISDLSIIKDESDRIFAYAIYEGVVGFHCKVLGYDQGFFSEVNEVESIPSSSFEGNKNFSTVLPLADNGTLLDILQERFDERPL